MKRARAWGAFAACVAGAWLLVAAPADPKVDQLWHLRNLGKAFYENPTTQLQAVGEFKKALDLNPDSARERINYGLALLRAGKTAEGLAELEKAQKQDPSIPHTWFNIGITHKKESEYEKAIAQLDKMAELVPDEPVTQYNLGVLYKLQGRAEDSLKKFEIAAKLDPNLAGPHFQLYNAYRAAGRKEDAARELAIFQDIKKKTAGAAVPEDLEWSFYAEIYETVDPLTHDGPAAELDFAAADLAVAVDPATAGAAAIDATGDGKPEVLVWSSREVKLFSGAGAVLDSGLSALKDVRAITPGDFNNDGLADLAVLTAKGAELWINEKGRFRRHGEPVAQGVFHGAVWIDYDHDYDLDLALLGAASKLLRNQGEAGFEAAEFPFVKGEATSGAIFELIADTIGTDLIVTYNDRPAVLYRDRMFGKFEPVDIAGLPAGTRGLEIADLDQDMWLDVSAAGPGGAIVLLNREGKFEAAPALSAKGAVRAADTENRGVLDLVAGGTVLRNQGKGRFTAGKALAEAAVAAAEADFNQDGRADLVVIDGSGKARLHLNQTKTQAQWMRVGLEGVKNLKLAPGAEVEVKAKSLYQKRVYHGVPLHFGLGPYTEVDTVRVTWPNGLIQNEAKQPAGKPAQYKEAQRLSGSCPMVFTWNGREYEFITDVLGVAPLGASAGDGETFPVDHDEYIQIPGSALAAVNGKYDIRLTEELREVAYLDAIQLIAVDHPADTEIFTNDKFKAPPFPEFRLFGVKQRIAPAAARDHRGNNVLSRVLRRDRVYPDAFRRDYAGVAEKHWIDLDFGRAAAGNRAVLVLSGWVDWADGSTFLGASQETPEGLIFPYVQVKDASGQWRTVIEDMGIPAGKPKTIVVDLTGKFLSDSREVRIVTNLCVYWDEIFLSEETGEPSVTLTALQPDTARLRFRGFSRPVIHPERKQPEAFDYQQWMPLSMWNPTPGLYTRYGDVKPLLHEVDDAMVIMGSGDELSLEFPAVDLPPLPSGWTRDFLLFVDGWAKDGDANTVYSQTVEPLPFHGMSRYPYPDTERFPMRELQRETTTRPGLRLIRPLSENRR
ncbi:MAG: VCBS repeat-containing protein [Bryobacterales bacterium]|nr:VCBS repeat-containing protein [Bryobacterales bacterium]